MRIKHFQGYGCVNAKKLGDQIVTNCFFEKEERLVIEVYGNHEWGLEVNDSYDVFTWLVQRFKKNLTINDYYGGIIKNYRTQYNYIDGVDHMTYYITLKVD